MTANSKIEWTHHTFNPWRGCSRVSAGCANCYAEAMSNRNPDVLGVWGPNGTRVVAAPSMWRQPLKWNSEAQCLGSFDCANGDHSDACPLANRTRVFCASLADVFEEWAKPMLSSDGCTMWICTACQITIDGAKREVQTNPPTCGACNQSTHPLLLRDVRRWLFSLIDDTWNLDWLLVTKRPENVRRMWKPTPGINPWNPDETYEVALESNWRHNVWLLASAEDQESFDRRAQHLAACRDLAPVLGWSIEPLLGPIRIDFDRCRWDWVIVGGESGPRSRPCHLQWIRSIVRQCRDAGVPCFVKQIGSEPASPYYSDDDNRDHVLSRGVVMQPVSGGGYCPWDHQTFGQPHPNAIVAWKPRHPKGADMNEWPDDLRVRQFPKDVTRRLNAT